MQQGSLDLYKRVTMNKINFFIACLFLLFGHTLAAEITAIGTIQPSAKSFVSTQVSGRIENIYLDVGAHVKKDQPLVQIDKRFYEIDLNQKAASLESAKLAMEDAEKNFLRMQKLWEKPQGETPSIPLKRFEEAKMKYALALTDMQQAQQNYHRAQLNLEETLIKAPYEGVITKKFVGIGEFLPVQPVINLIEIQALNPLYLEFFIPQKDAENLCRGSPIHFEIEGSPMNHSATIDLFFPTLDDSTHSLRCRAIIDNKDYKIRPGSLVKVRLKDPLQQETSHGTLEGTRS